MALGDFNLSGELLTHLFNRISAEIKIANLADIFPLHMTDDDRGIVVSDQAEQFVTALRAGKIEDIGAGFEAGARDRWVVGFDGDENAGRAQSLDGWQQFAVLRGFGNAFGMSECRFRTDVHDIRPLRTQNLPPLDGAVRRPANTLAIP